MDSSYRLVQHRNNPEITMNNCIMTAIINIFLRFIESTHESITSLLYTSPHNDDKTYPVNTRTPPQPSSIYLSQSDIFLSAAHKKQVYCYPCFLYISHSSFIRSFQPSRRSYLFLGHFVVTPTPQRI